MKKVKPFKLLFQDEQALGMLAGRLNGGFSTSCYPQSPVYLKWKGPTGSGLQAEAYFLKGRCRVLGQWQKNIAPFIITGALILYRQWFIHHKAYKLHIYRCCSTEENFATWLLERFPILATFWKFLWWRFPTNCHDVAVTAAVVVVVDDNDNSDDNNKNNSDDDDENNNDINDCDDYDGNANDIV